MKMNIKFSRIREIVRSNYLDRSMQHCSGGGGGGGGGKQERRRGTQCRRRRE